jgi:hypothetical protein
MDLIRRALILTHRYLGIPLSIVFIIWFVSGIVMMYAGGMPSLSPQARIDQLPAIDFDAVALSANDAARQAGLARPPSQAHLLTVLGRPAWRFGGLGGPTTVFADTGETLGMVGLDRAREISASFAGVPVTRVHYVEAVSTPDQWTIGLARELPLHRLRVDDSAGTQLYVSPRTAEVVLATTRQSRALAWAGTIPHWFYVTPLRVNQPLWYWTVVIASALGCVVAIIGIVLAFTQLRRTRPFSLSRAIPYRGVMRWHYITGAVFGLFALTWAFSGMLSVQPFAWQNVAGLSIRADALSGGPLELEGFPLADGAAWNAALNGYAAKELELTRIEDRPWYVLRYTAADDKVRLTEHQFRARERSQPPRALIDAATLRVREQPFDTQSLVARLARAAGDATIAQWDLLDQYDPYYYSRSGQAPLPVLRVKFDDPERTWYYVDPQMGRIVAGIHRMNRLERWLFNGLHSLDFTFWYARRPLWDIGLIVLSIGALATSTIGLWLGVGRIRRFLTRSRTRA